MTKERYEEIINFAKKQRAELEENLDPIIIAENLALEYFKDKNEREIFINNFIITNTKEFLELRLNCGKNIIKIAQELKIPVEIVISKLSEISIFEKYIEEKEETKKEL